MILQSLLFHIMFGHLFPDLPELKARVFLQYIEAAQNAESGRNLLGNLLDPAERTRMDHVVRNQFLTILMYRHLLRRLIGDFGRNSSNSKINRRMTAEVLNRIINQMLTPLVSFFNLKPINDSCKIFQRCAMRVIVHQLPISVSYYHGGFQLSFTYPTCEYSDIRRIEQLARPFFRRIDPTNEVLSVNIFVVWTLYAKIILDLDDRKRFGLHENPARLVEKLVENIIKSLTDDEILAIFSSYEFSTIVRIYIRLHIGQNKIRAIEARKRISRELVWEMVEDSMSEYHRRVRLEYSELRRSKFNVHVVQSFVRLLQSSSMIPSMTLRQWGSKHQIQDLKDQIEAQQLDIQGSFPFIASNVLMELQNLVSVFFSVDHHFEIDLNELTFLVIWTATYNVRCKRHRLIVRSKPWLEQSDWSEQQLLRSASPELILFFATFAKLNEGISLMMVFKWFSDKKRRLRPD
jgi:hypothetical protein